MTKEYVIDGSQVTSLESFYDLISDVIIPGTYWGRNLDAFDEILRGGFGTPNEGFVLRWTHSEVSRARLAYPETIRQLEKRLERCHPANRASVEADLNRAKHLEGPMVFDWLIEIIRDHDVGGEQAEDGVRLVLE
jgi:RNAse (barnase) inhibitor barstar